MIHGARVLLAMTLFATTLVASACQQVKQLTSTIGGLISLSKDIGATFDEPNVSCNLVNGTSLTISVVNSSRRNLSDEARRAVALDIARYAYTHFESRGDLSTVAVRYVRNWSIIVFTYNETTDLFSFSGDDLADWYRQQASPLPDRVDAGGLCDGKIVPVAPLPDLTVLRSRCKPVQAIRA